MLSSTTANRADAGQMARDVARLNAILQAAVDAIISVDERGVIRLVNPAVERLFGYAPEEIVGNTVSQLMPEPARSRYGARLESYLASGHQEMLGSREVVGQRKDGSTFPLGMSVAEAAVEDERVFVCILRDLTEWKRAEGALRESEERLRLFFEHAPAALAMFDREMRYLAVSRRWNQDYGLGDADLVGRSHYDVFPDLPAHWKEVHREANVVRAAEDRFVRQDGREQWLRWEVRPWHTGAGDVGGIVIFTEDISERKRAEETLRENQSRNQRILDVLPSGVIVNSGGRIAYCNPAMARMLGMANCEDLLGTPALAIVHPRFHQQARERVATILEQGVAVPVKEVELLNHDGMSIPVAVMGAPIEFQGQDSILVVVDDLRERKEIERHFRTMVESVKDYAIYSLDPDGRVTTWNLGAERLTGYTADEAIGMRYAEFFTGDDMRRGEPERHLQHAAKFGELAQEGWRVCKDGSQFWPTSWSRPSATGVAACWDSSKSLATLPSSGGRIRPCGKPRRIWNKWSRPCKTNTRN